MNTTESDNSGWVDVRAQPAEYPDDGKWVMIFTKEECIHIANWNSREWFTENLIRFTTAQVTHWREMPEPPKSKDAFEKWWGTLKQDEEDSEFRYVNKDDDIVFEPAARCIWEAAINSTKQ